MTPSNPITDGACLYEGRVVHARLNPLRHRFRYRFFTGLFDLDRLATLSNEHRLFSYNKRNLFSFFDADHGPRDGTSLKEWVIKLLDDANLSFDRGQIKLLCLPRVLGYVFNPLSIFYCYDKRGDLKALLYEVQNTFRESHTYVIPVTLDENKNVTRPHHADKSFYVSPFIGMEARYHFSLSDPNDTIAVNIRQKNKEGDLLLATLNGSQSAFSDRAMIRLLFAYPFLTFGVVAAIHWQAFRLWLKGAKYFGHAASKPAEKTSHEIVQPDLTQVT